MESVQSKMRKTDEAGFSTFVGFASTLVLDTVEFAGGTWFAISYALQGKDMGAGYSFFSNKVDTVRNLIEENIPDKQAYNVGEITGNVFEIFEAGKGIYKIATKGIPQIKNIFKMFPAGGNGGTAGTAVLSKTLAIVGELAESVTTVGVVAEGTAAEVTFAEKLAQNIQEYSESGNVGNEIPKTTGGKNEKIKNINNESKTNDINKRLIDGSTMKTDEVLDLATDFLGEGYTEPIKGSGRYVSKDGKRVVRMGDNDILGRHGGGSHVNFELLEPNPSKAGKMQVIKDIHIYLED